MLGGGEFPLLSPLAKQEVRGMECHNEGIDLVLPTNASHNKSLCMSDSYKSWCLEWVLSSLRKRRGYTEQNRTKSNEICTFLANQEEISILFVFAFFVEPPDLKPIVFKLVCCFGMVFSTCVQLRNEYVLQCHIY